MTEELKPCPFCGIVHEDMSMHVLTPEGWKPAKYIEYEPPKWYIRPFLCLLKPIFRRINHE